MSIPAKFELVDERDASEKRTFDVRRGLTVERTLGDDVVAPNAVKRLEAALAMRANDNLTGKRLRVASLHITSTLSDAHVDAVETYGAAGAGPGGPALAGAMLYAAKSLLSRPTLYIRAGIYSDDQLFNAFTMTKVSIGMTPEAVLAKDMSDIADQLIRRMRLLSE